MAKWFSGLFGSKSAPVRGSGGANASAKAAAPSRAQLIKDALALHEARGAELRAALNTELKRLENPRTLRDAAELQRLLALAQARKAMARLLGGDLRRYLVLTGLRQWSGHEPASPDAARPTKKIIRRR